VHLTKLLQILESEVPRPPAVEIKQILKSTLWKSDNFSTVFH